MWSYKNRAAQDLKRWHAAGWVTDDGAKAIGAELAASSGGFTAASILALSGVVLLAFAAMSFVAANWQDIPRLVRLLLLFVLSASAYWGAGALFARNYAAFGHAAVLLGAALFGANIMLVGQMYHVAGRPRDLVFIWGVIAFLSGVAFRSGPTTAMALLLATLWSTWVTAATGEIHWPFVIAWGVITAALIWQKASFALYLAGGVMSAWVLSLGLPEWGLTTGFWLPLFVGLVVGAISVVTELSSDRTLSRIGRVALGFALLVVIFALTGLQYSNEGTSVSEIPLTRFILYSAAELVVLVLVMWWCVERNNHGVLWLAYVLFSFVVLSIYFRTVGSLLGSSLFFLVAGVIVIVLAWCAHVLRSRTVGHKETA